MTLVNCGLSFDPSDPYFAIPDSDGVSLAVQVFTTQNGYGLDRTRVTASPEVDNFRVHASGFARLGQQAAAGDGEVSVEVRREGARHTINVEVRHCEPIKSVKLLFKGLPSDGWWSPTTPKGAMAAAPFQWNYPGAEWATRWAASGDTTISIRDSEVSGAVLHIEQPAYASGPIAEVVHSIRADSWAPTVTLPPVALARTLSEDAVQSDLRAHHDFITGAFGLQPWGSRQDAPAWLEHLAAVVTLHGQHWTGHIFHTFDEMANILRQVAEVVDGDRVLAYLPGWEGRYYHSYPEYQPGDAMGGSAGFARLAAAARETGVRLMPMFGANGANVDKYPRWREAVILNDAGEYPDMLNSPDWDGDRYPEGKQVFLNPGEPVFRRDLVDSMSRIVEEFGVDAVFLDTASFWFNDPRYPLYDGYLALRDEFHARHPHTLIAGEGWWDAMTAVFPLSQQWLGVPRDIRYPEILTRHSRTTGHLAEGAPPPGSTGVHEQGFRIRGASADLEGHIPSVSFAGGDPASALGMLADLHQFGRPTSEGASVGHGTLAH